MTILQERPVTAPSVAIEWVTPEIAAEYLSKNIENNRKAKPSRIAAYARDIETGHWLFTGEAIKFDVDGHLVDGQNRCLAVLRAGLATQILVVRGLSKEAVYVLDSGMSRSGADAIHISGAADKSDPKNLAATARLHRSWTGGELGHAMTTGGAMSTMTKSELIEYLELNPTLDFAARYGQTVYGHLRLPISALAVAFDAFSRIDIDDTAEFFNRIRDGISGGPGDPFLTLSRRVTSDHLDGPRSIMPATALFYLFRTWNAFRSNEQLSRLQTGSRTSGWAPIPSLK